MEIERNDGGERRTRRYSRGERPPLPREQSSSHAVPPMSKREHIDKVAMFVAEEEDQQVEEILLKLLRITKNQERWGFLSADDPYHAYYCRRIAECRQRIAANGI